MKVKFCLPSVKFSRLHDVKMIGKHVDLYDGDIFICFGTSTLMEVNGFVFVKVIV